MKKGVRNKRFTIRLNLEEEMKLAEIYNMSNSRKSISSFMRDMMLGNVEHPLLPENSSHLLDVKDHGPLNGAYDNMIHYQGIIIAAEFLRIQHDPEYAKVIKANRPVFDKIIKQVRGYEFDEKEAVKIPLKTSR